MNISSRAESILEESEHCQKGRYLNVSVWPSSAANRRGVYPCWSHMLTSAPPSIRISTTAWQFCLTAEKRVEPIASGLRAPLEWAEVLIMIDYLYFRKHNQISTRWWLHLMKIHKKKVLWSFFKKYIYFFFSCSMFIQNMYSMDSEY